MEKPKPPVIDLLRSDSDPDPNQSQSQDPHPDPEQSQGQDAEPEVEVKLDEKKPIPSAEPDLEDIVDEPGRMEVEEGANNGDEEEEDEIEGMYVGSWTTPEV